MLPDFRLRQREYLLEISRAMSARLDLSSLLELSLKSAVEILAGQAGLITLRRNDGSFVPQASIGLPYQAVPLFEPLWRDLDSEGQRGIPDMSLRLALASRAAGVLLRQVVAIQQKLHHGRQRSVKGPLHGAHDFTALGLFFRYDRVIQEKIADSFLSEQPLGDHSVHHCLNGAVRPGLVVLKCFLHSRRRTGLVIPYRLNNRPFTFGQLISLLCHINLLFFTYEKLTLHL